MYDFCMCVQYGRTPLQYASENGHADVVKLLLALKGGEELTKAENAVSAVGKARVHGDCWANV
jgi:ankyrin repeat protein